MTYLVVVTPLALWVVLISNSTMARAERALVWGDYQSAIRLATEELHTDPKSDRAFMVAGSAASALRNLSAAHNYFSLVSPTSPQLLSIAQRELGRMAFSAGRLTEAEERIRASLELNPRDVNSVDQLIFLLTVQGRSFEARRIAFDAIRSGIVTSNYLTIILTHRPKIGLDVDYANKSLSVIPDDPLPRLAIAKKAWSDQRSDEGLKQLRLVLQRYPDLLEAHALLGQILVETGTSEEFEDFYNRLPATATSRPEIWVSRGIAAERRTQLEEAARCYWEAVKIDPNLQQANFLLSQALVKLKQVDSARIFATRSERLSKLSLDHDSIQDTVRQLEDLGREWEAAGWCEVLLQKTGYRPTWARLTQLKLSRGQAMSTALTSPTSDPSLSVDLSHYRLPQFEKNTSMTSARTPTKKSDSGIAFQDDAERLGLKFIYVNGAPGGDLESMLEMNGGGVAVLDYDGDHWPDIYFTQGGSLPPASFDSSQSDRLFRNRGNLESKKTSREFEDVTALAGIRDLGYGQGVTVGDFDNDGFPDLYVGNIGRNQFYKNNGDGTFTDVTITTGASEVDSWTSSCVLVDLNQDGLPDLYVVTYLAGKTPYELCKKQGGVRCAPLSFPAEPDRFYLNLGEGRFHDLSGECGLAAPDGRGLGVVAADFDDSGRLSLFVGNDMSANFYFHNKPPSVDSPQFEEKAFQIGLAVDHMGRVKACMGIAAGDYNNDGRLDLFVTNFYREANDMYTQQADGLFRELSRAAKLFEPSFLMLGWGTQFLDADLDGDPDLIVTNGHVHDPVDPAIPFAMSPQFFRNQGDATFAELSSKQLGEFFQQKMHGRSLARLDWNRDGLEDACISHVNQPAALLTNRTERPGRFLAFHLTAVDSARDAIGTRIKVSIGDRMWVGQLTAGDGFQASNDRRLVFGLGENTVADSIEVFWPSGSHQQFSQVNLNTEYQLVEHRSLIVLMHHD